MLASSFGLMDESISREKARNFLVMRSHVFKSTGLKDIYVWCAVDGGCPWAFCINAPCLSLLSPRKGETC